MPLCFEDCVSRCSARLVKTWMAKSELDAGWGMLKTLLRTRASTLGRSVCVVSERDSTRTCSSCGSRTGPTGLDMCAVRIWICSECGEMVWTCPHFEVEVRGELEKKVDPPVRRHQSAQGGRCSVFTGF